MIVRRWGWKRQVAENKWSVNEKKKRPRDEMGNEEKKFVKPRKKSNIVVPTPFPDSPFLAFYVQLKALYKIRTYSNFTFYTFHSYILLSISFTIKNLRYIFIYFFSNGLHEFLELNKYSNTGVNNFTSPTLIFIGPNMFVMYLQLLLLFN